MRHGSSEANINLHGSTLWVFLIICKEATHGVYQRGNIQAEKDVEGQWNTPRMRVLKYL